MAKTSAKTSRAYYQAVVQKYLGDARGHFTACGLIPDGDDLAGCVFEFWGQDSPVDLDDSDYQGILDALIHGPA
jgi:hypothetical protein